MEFNGGPNDDYKSNVNIYMDNFSECFKGVNIFSPKDPNFEIEHNKLKNCITNNNILYDIIKDNIKEFL